MKPKELILRLVDAVVLWRYSSLRRAASAAFAWGLAIEQMRRRRAIGIDPEKNLQEFEDDYQRIGPTLDDYNDMGVAELQAIQAARQVVSEMKRIQSWGGDELTKRLFDLQQAIYTVDRAEDIAIFSGTGDVRHDY